MEGCLLCLEINEDIMDCIKVGSTQWQNLNIRNLILKHLWTVESILPSSWVCYICWKELYDFHKFYMRIEEAHMDFGKLMKTDIELQDHKEETKDSSTNKGNKILFDKDVLSETPFEEEILLDQLVREYQNPTIKVEQIEELGNDNIFKSSQDPLKNTKKSSSLKSNNQKTNDALKCNSSIESSVHSSKSVQLSTSDALLMLDTSEIVENSSDSDHSFTESDNKTVDKAAKRIKKTKTNPRRERDRSKLQAKDIFLSKNFNMSCVLCETPMNNFKALLKHFDVEHKERGYVVCCKKKIYKRSVLLEHVNRHVDPNYFKCNQCGKVLSTRKVLKTHQLLHLSEEEKKYSCNECGKNFAEQHLLSNHIRSVHLRKYIKICDMCGKTLRSSDIFERHMSEHEGKPMPPVNCEICGLRLSHKKALKRHMDMQHPVGGQQSQICHICLKVSPNIVALKKHINCTHNTGNIHKCTICGRGFKRVQALRDHMATHTGTALYTCPWCPKTFNSNGCMHAHRKKHHPKEWEQAHRQKYLEKYKLPAVTEIINGGIS